MTAYYHVTKKWDNEDLETLTSRFGKDAYDLFVERWPEAADIALEHANLIHLHENRADAEKFAAEFGGEILAIELDEYAADEVGLEIDYTEYPHPVAHENIPAEYIRRMA